MFRTPDFAQLGPPVLENRDLLFLFEHFPVPGVDAVQAVQRMHERPGTLESLLESRYVHDAIRDQSTLWLEVTPRLFFNVMLRRSLPGRRNARERRAIHYLANLLGLFVRAERMYQVEPGDERAFQYLVDLIQEAAQAAPARRFAVQSHIGNYSLVLSGLFHEWIEHRHRYRRRPVTVEYYCKMGRSYFFTASQHWLAAKFGVQDVFGELAERFDYYRGGLMRLAGQHLRH
jgi:hypothetical protein